MGGLVEAVFWDAGAFFLAGLDFLGESMARLGGACLALSTWMFSLRALTTTYWRNHKYVRTVQRSLSLESLGCAMQQWQEHMQSYCTEVALKLKRSNASRPMQKQQNG